jgi:hypothetical protein
MVTLRVDFGDVDEARFIVLGLNASAEVLEPRRYASQSARDLRAPRAHWVFSPWTWGSMEGEGCSRLRRSQSETPNEPERMQRVFICRLPPSRASKQAQPLVSRASSP